LQWDKKVLAQKLLNYLRFSQANEKERATFDFVVELITLRFSLFKWGKILFSFEQEHDVNSVMLLTLQERKQFLLLSEYSHFFRNISDDKGMMLLEMEQEKIIHFPDPTNRNSLGDILVFLYTLNDTIGICIKEEKSYLAQFEGAYVSLQKSNVMLDEKGIQLMQKQFFTFKQRLSELENIFISNFT
jgi:hypothetical protein